MKISIVTTLFYSQDYIVDFYKSCTKHIVNLFNDYEIIFVNDGSPDNSVEIVEKLCSKDLNVKLIDLSRNFGHHKALITGIDNCSGDYIFITDVDLEEKPSNFKKFWEIMNSEKDLDHVYAVQVNRKGDFFEKISGYLFYRIYNLLSDVKIDENIITSRLMTKRFTISFKKFKEHEIFIAGLAVLNGFNSKKIQIAKLSNLNSSYSFKHKLKLFINSITAFSSKPLYFIFYMGVVLFVGCMFIAICLIILAINEYFTVTGWASIILLIISLGGIILMSIGILSIYISKILIEVKKRPYVIIKRILNG